MYATDLVGINGTTRVLSVHTVSKVCAFEAMYYPFDSRTKPQPRFKSHVKLQPNVVVERLMLLLNNRGSQVQI
jgi:hypothetical protein